MKCILFTLVIFGCMMPSIRASGAAPCSLLSITASNSSGKYITYNANGLVDSVIEKDSMGRVTSIYIAQYNAGKQLIRYANTKENFDYLDFSYNATGKIDNEVKYNYNKDSQKYCVYILLRYQYEDEKITVSSYSNSGRLKSKSIFNLDKNKNVTQVDHYSIAGKLINSEVYEYDTRKNYFGGDKYLMFNYGLISYGSNNILSITIKAGSKSKIVSAYEYDYNAKGYPVKCRDHSRMEVSYNYKCK